MVVGRAKSPIRGSVADRVGAMAGLMLKRGGLEDLDSSSQVPELAIHIDGEPYLPWQDLPHVLRNHLLLSSTTAT